MEITERQKQLVVPFIELSTGKYYPYTQLYGQHFNYLDVLNAIQSAHDEDITWRIVRRYKKLGIFELRKCVDHSFPKNGCKNDFRMINPILRTVIIYFNVIDAIRETIDKSLQSFPQAVIDLMVSFLILRADEAIQKTRIFRFVINCYNIDNIAEYYLKWFYQNWKVDKDEITRISKTVHSRKCKCSA